ncbi:MAG: putative nucleotidyltransferase substrate binding domain-containing protein [Micropruina sp.]|uniref:putative nucleotidyltransferase substrate binding domain-containing protein n=1 Tax=Micropruina sp. TaxID=2737536 RepID=UPI0039E5C2ED
MRDAYPPGKGGQVRVQAMAALAASPPFDTLDARTIEELAGVSRIAEYDAGEQILDAFRGPPSEVLVVVSGRVRVWTDAERPHDPESPDLISGPGEVFGLNATLTGKAIGPLAVADGPVRVVRLPADRAARALPEPDAAREDDLPQPPDTDLAGQAGLRVADLDVDPLLVLPGGVTVQEAALAMAVSGLAAVELPEGRLGIVTDRTLRRRVLAAGLSPQTPVGAVAVTDCPRVSTGSSAPEALILLLDTQADHVLVTDADDRLVGTLEPRDFIGSPVTAGLALHERIRRSADIQTLQQQAGRMPELLADLLAGGLASAAVLSVYSALVDAVTRRTLQLVFAGHPDLSLDSFSWLSLGSNGRRESTLSSDVDCAVAFHQPLSADGIDRYREVFLEVTQCLARSGLTGDGHGATAAHQLFARTDESWEASAGEWLEDPSRNNAAMMASLLLDARAIHGAPQVPGVARMAAGLRAHPAGLRMFLEESLAKRARLRPLRRIFWGRDGFDIKRNALLPIVNLSRWLGLMAGSPALTTTERLRAAAGSSILPQRQAATLVEVFEVLQAIRLRHQLRQVQRGRPATDRLNLDRVSAIDRSIIARAVREISTVQQRMANVSRYEGPEDWARPDPQPTGDPW